MIALVLAAALSAAADPTHTEVGAPPPQPAPAAEAKAKEKNPQLVCWNETPTGSHFSTRVCANKDALEAQGRRDRDALSQGTRSTQSGLGAGH